MRPPRFHTTIVVILILLAIPSSSGLGQPRSNDAVMTWWREARFGLFIHWGLYAIPAGTWEGKTDYGEWIRFSARIPLTTYDGFVQQFNPAKFDPAAWVRMAKAAGMKYIVITSKHHDGFALFDAPGTDFDVMSTPFKRDIMKELSDECHKQGMRICWYYSIMDWHHPDYLPRRTWESGRDTTDARFDRYVAYMKEHLRSLVTQYGDIGILWFDGEWESTWNMTRGADLAAFVRSLAPHIIINNRVDGGRAGMQGFSQGGVSAGDYGTPEQEIPATGLPGVDWETCMTMNDHWGYNDHDRAWKSSRDLIRMLADIASKGGNYLLNVGPRADGTFPPESVERLAAIGAWMKVNGEAIHGTTASPFAALPFGRCTQKPVPGGTRLYLHVFDWPADRTLLLPGLMNTARTASLLGDAKSMSLPFRATDEGVVITLPPAAPDTINTVVALDITGAPEVVTAPQIIAPGDVFCDAMQVEIAPPPRGITTRYTLDGTAPTLASPAFSTPIMIAGDMKMTARHFRNGRPIGPPTVRTFAKVEPSPAVAATPAGAGVRCAYFLGSWTTLPPFASLTPASASVVPEIAVSLPHVPEHYGLTFEGLLRVDTTGVYTFTLASDDGSRLLIDGKVLVEHDGLHALSERSASAPLGAGLHRIRVEYFQGEGGDGFALGWARAGATPVPIPAEHLFHD
jgi:alpha-L-fucosidase